MTKKRTYSLEEAKAFRDKLAELRPEVNAGLEKLARGLQGLADGVPNAVRAIEEALAPLREASCQWAGGRWARNMVVNTADRTLSKIGADSETSAAVRSCRSDFVASFEAFAADAELKRATREAILEAIVNALYIGLASDDPSLLTRLRNDQAAHMRQGRASRSAESEAIKKRAVRQAMSEEKTYKATSGIAYAKRIQPRVQELLDLYLPVKDGEDRFQISDWKVCDVVKKIRNEPQIERLLKSQPGESGDS